MAGSVLGIETPEGIDEVEFNEWLTDSLIGYFGKRVEDYIAANNLRELGAKLESTDDFEVYWQILEENLENFGDFKKTVLADFKKEVEKEVERSKNDTGN